MTERKPKTLVEIADRMAAIASDGGDEERDHIDADDLLIEAILLVGGEVGKRIAKEYAAIGKWYA
jgi:hypothetical protein